MLSGILMHLVFAGSTPNTVNPTLWRQAKVKNDNLGYFK